MNLESDNLEITTNGYGEIMVEPQYIQFIRENGFTIDGIEDVRVIPSESDKEKAYFVAKVETYRKPKDHPELDVIEDQITLPVCSCWAYRQNSHDVTKNMEPHGRCKHIEQTYMVEKAKNDNNQTTL